jgi:hypothetical protein
MVHSKKILAGCVFLLAILVLILPHPATAAGVVDQNYTPSFGSASANWIQSSMPMGQAFTPTKSSLVGVDLGLDNVLVTDQSYNPGFAGAGWNWINAHTPIGQSFTPTMPLLGGVSVGILDEAILDQSFAPSFGCSGCGWNWVQAHQPVGQSFTPTYPQLWYVQLGLENPSGSPVSLTLNLRQATITGTILGTQTFSVPVGGPSWIDVTFWPYPGIAVTPGATYVLDLVGGGASTVRWYVQNPGGSYSGGSAITDGSIESGADYFFKTYGFGNTITANIHQGTIGGPVITTKTIPIPPMDFPIFVDFNFTTPVPVTPGTTYVLELQQSPESVRWYIVTPGGGYTGGNAITDGTPDPGGDYLFTTYGAGDSLTVNIRSSTISGTILGSDVATVPVTAPTLVHVDFPTAIALTPGSPYVIELQQSVTSMRWYIVTPGGGYPGGKAITSGATDPNGDYIFQTYAAAGPTATSLNINFTPPTVDLSTPPGTGTITATLNPPVAGEAITLYYSVNPLGPWTVIGTGNTNPSGAFTITWSPPATGTYYFRADFTGDSNYSPSTTTSTPNSMVVVPEFPAAVTPLLAALAIGIVPVLTNRSKRKRKR